MTTVHDENVHNFVGEYLAEYEHWLKLTLVEIWNFLCSKKSENPPYVCPKICPVIQFHTFSCLFRFHGFSDRLFLLLKDEQSANEAVNFEFLWFKKSQDSKNVPEFPNFR